MSFDIEVSTYTISKVVIRVFDIEYLRHRYTISNAQTFDIECTYDIEDFDIDCDLRYRRFNGSTLDIGVPRIQMFGPGNSLSGCRQCVTMTVD